MSMHYMDREEVLFITIEDNLISTTTHLLRHIRDKYLKAYESFININMIKDKTDFELSELAIQRTTENIIQYLAIREFDWDGAYRDLVEDDTFIFHQAPNLIFMNKFDLLSSQEFVKTIYLYSEEYDERCLDFIKTKFLNCAKIHYVTGPIRDVLTGIKEKPTMYLLNNVDHVHELIGQEMIEYTEILLPSTGINLDYSRSTDQGLPYPKIDVEAITKSFNCKIGYYNPLI